MSAPIIEPVDPSRADLTTDPAATPPTPAGMSILAPALVSVGAVALLIGLTVWRVSYGDSVPGLDSGIHDWILPNRNGVNVGFARGTTWFGVVPLLLPALFVLGAMASRAGSSTLQRLRTGLLVTAMPALGIWLGLRMNAELGRKRPSVADWLSSASGPSFPSGHTTAATIFFGSAALLLASHVRSGWPRVFVWSAAALAAFLVGWSRVWLGVHWPTDVFAGWLWGVAWSAFTVFISLQQLRLLKRRFWRRGAPEARTP